MAVLTQLPFDAAQDLLDRYGIHLDELTPLQAGSVNSNFFLSGRSSQGQTISYFARIYEEQGASGAHFELALNQALKRAKIPVAEPIRTQDGEMQLSYQGKPFAVYQRLTGHVTCQKGVTPAMAHSVGRSLAQVHVADLGALELSESRFGFDGIATRLSLVRSSGRQDLLPAVDRIEALCQELSSRPVVELPRGLIHGDLFRDNVLIEGEEVVGLLDFESASRGTFVYDLMVTLLAWCFGDTLRLDLASGMLRGYDSVRPLSSVERAQMVNEGSFACARFATTRLTDFSLRVTEGELPIRDFRRFFERLDAIKSVGYGEMLKSIEWRTGL